MAFDGSADNADGAAGGFADGGVGRDGVAGVVVDELEDHALAAYSASKAGLIGLVKSLAMEFARTRLTVNAIAPATIDTPMMKDTPAERRLADRESIPVGRFGTPDEAAALISYVASVESGFTTGFAYDLSGGRAQY